MTWKKLNQYWWFFGKLYTEPSCFFFYCPDVINLDWSVVGWNRTCCPRCELWRFQLSTCRFQFVLSVSRAIGADLHFSVFQFRSATNGSVMIWVVRTASFSVVRVLSFCLAADVSADWVKFLTWKPWQIGGTGDLTVLMSFRSLSQRRQSNECK